MATNAHVFVDDDGPRIEGTVDGQEFRINGYDFTIGSVTVSTDRVRALIQAFDRHATGVVDALNILSEPVDRGKRFRSLAETDA